MTKKAPVGATLEVSLRLLLLQERGTLFSVGGLYSPVNNVLVDTIPR